MTVYYVLCIVYCLVSVVFMYRILCVVFCVLFILFCLLLYSVLYCIMYCVCIVSTPVARISYKGGLTVITGGLIVSRQIFNRAGTKIGNILQGGADSGG